MTRILIVDDSPTEVFKLTSLLEKNGYEVLKAENGADGVALARKEKPDAVLKAVKPRHHHVHQHQRPRYRQALG